MAVYLLPIIIQLYTDEGKVYIPLTVYSIMMKEDLKTKKDIQERMSKERCPTCQVKYKGHRSGSYSPNLKAVYERQGAKGVFVKVGYRCPVCNEFFKLEEVDKE